jgi:hypothetical protein
MSGRVVCGLDVERERPVFWFNSTVERFVRTFALLDRYLGDCQPLPSEIEACVRDTDPAAYSRSVWRLIIDRLRLSED